MPASLPADTPASVGEKPGPPSRRGTLLIVDDEEGPRESLRVVFKDAYELLTAGDGPTAVELAQKNRVDVALLDIRMSGMSGIEVLERLKYLDPTVEVIMLTAFETTDLMRQALRLHASDYIVKPFDVASVRAAVATAMNRRLLASEIHTNVEKLQGLLDELQSHKIEEQVARARGDIYASMIHDINNPLTVISGFVRMVNERIGTTAALEIEDLEFVRERIKTINRQVQKCVEISQRYKSYLQRQPGAGARLSTNQLLSDLRDLVRVHPSAQHHEFEVRPLSEDAAVQMNGTDFIHVLLNLAVNAFQCSSQPHQVEVEAQLLGQPLDLARFKDSSRERVLNVESFDNTAPILAVAVRDNGPGIPPEVLSKIFDPYFTTKSSRQGTGLGLNIVQRMVKQARGLVHVRTKVGDGTTFTVYLPATRAASGTPGKA